MRKSSKQIIIIIILVAVIVCALGLRFYNGYMFFFDMPDRSGWVGEGDERRYLDRHAGVITDTLLKIENETYYFGHEGAVTKGEIELGGFRYYFSETTGVMQTGWVERDGRRYY
jgi:glucan-binding YG repeat protein